MDIEASVASIKSPSARPSCTGSMKYHHVKSAVFDRWESTKASSYQAQALSNVLRHYYAETPDLWLSIFWDASYNLTRSITIFWKISALLSAVMTSWPFILMQPLLSFCFIILGTIYWQTQCTCISLLTMTWQLTNRKSYMLLKGLKELLPVLSILQ